MPLVGASTVLRIRRRGRLAGAVGSQQAVDFAALGRERQIVERNELPAVQVGVRLAEMAGFDHGGEESSEELCEQGACGHRPKAPGRSSPRASAKQPHL